jgi:uncharacterized protein (DUF885 family)
MAGSVAAAATPPATPAATPPATPAATHAASSAATPAASLHALFAASDEASLKRNPIAALARGDLRYAAHFGDLITDDYFAAERQAALDDLAGLARIDRSALGPKDRVSYDVFRFQRTEDLNGFEPALLKA